MGNYSIIEHHSPLTYVYANGEPWRLGPQALPCKKAIRTRLFTRSVIPRPHFLAMPEVYQRTCVFIQFSDRLLAYQTALTKENSSADASRPMIGKVHLPDFPNRFLGRRTWKK